MKAMSLLASKLLQTQSLGGGSAWFVVAKQSWDPIERAAYARLQLNVTTRG